MTIQAVAWALYGDHGDIDPSARLVLVVLADHAGTEHVAWPARSKMAAAAGCSVDTVDRRLRELVDLELIVAASPEETPSSWHHLRADRRPRAYRLGDAHAGPSTVLTGPQSAAPSNPTGPHGSGSADATGPQTGATGPQNRGHGAAAVRYEPNEPNLEKTRGRARDADGDSRPDSRRPHPPCGRIHDPSVAECPRRQAPDVAARGAAAARAARAASLAAARS